MNQQFIDIENEDKVYRIKKSEVVKITINLGILNFYLDDGRVLSKTMTLKKGMEILPDFVKIYRNTAINRYKIREICKTTRIVKLENDETLKVSFRNISKIRLTNKKIRLTSNNHTFKNYP